MGEGARSLEGRQMTPYEWLGEVVDAANRVVERTWVGHFDLPAASGDGTARDVLDRMFRSVTSSTVALGGDGAEAGMPFTYGWVPRSDFVEAAAVLVEAAGGAARLDPGDERVCGAANDLLRLTIDLADTIGTSYGPSGTERHALAALPRR